MIVIKEDMMKKSMSPPFPQSLRGKKGVNNSSEIFELLRQVEVNIPHLDMIKPVPTYAKFLKDLCTVKRGLNVDKKALLDLGASVNLLPYLVYKKIGLGELKPTTITLSLEDRSMKIPKGIVEDVLVKVDKFYYPVDFIFIDTEPIATGANYVPIILERPFLATSNAIINCRNGVMQLTFGMFIQRKKAQRKCAWFTLLWRNIMLRSSTTCNSSSISRSLSNSNFNRPSSISFSSPFPSSYTNSFSRSTN